MMTSHDASWRVALAFATDRITTCNRSVRDHMVGRMRPLARVGGVWSASIALDRDELPAYLRRLRCCLHDDATMRRGGIGRVAAM